MQKLVWTCALLLAALCVLVSLAESSPVQGTNSLRVRRSSSDQRIAELQALMALTGHEGSVAHGQFDPQEVGKKKRDFSDEQRYQILKSLIERAAENNMPQ